jgi:hypothetical protein
VTLAAAHFNVWSVDHGISELPIDYGPGHKVYFIQRGSVLVVVLADGDKRIQHADIQTIPRPKAPRLASPSCTRRTPRERQAPPAPGKVHIEPGPRRSVVNGLTRRT